MFWFTTGLLVLGALGGEVAKLIGLPLPWMLGSLLSTAVVVAVLPHRIPVGFRFSQRFRMVFISIIGAMIGAQLTLDVLTQWRPLVFSLLGVTVFVALAHGWNYWLFRRIGRFDKATAFYCGTPGGLIESITLGEAAGAEIRMLTVMQFLRIILVVTLVPLGISIVEGHPVGSADGVGFTPGAGHLSSIPVLLVIGGVGLLVGRLLRLPAAQLVGPLLVSAVLSGTGLITLDPPNWVISVAQVVIGVSLGSRFIGVTGRLLRRALGLSLVSVIGMLGIGVTLAVILNAIDGHSILVLILSLAPGGVTEMGLVALSLAANPALVAFHHLYRIILTVLEMAVVGRWLMRSGP